MKRITRTAIAFGLGAAALAFTAAMGPQDTAAKAKIGEAAPAWKLTDIKGKEHELKDFAGKTVVLEWTNPGCPYIVGVYDKGVVSETVKAMKEMGKDYVYIAVNSTGNKAKDAVIKENTDFLAKHKMDIPVVIDHDGTVGKTYGAKTTPHMYVIDTKGVLRYHGAFTDDPGSRKSPEHVNYVVQSLKQLAAGETVTPDHTKQWGCSVKYVAK
ncbi:MAG: redoxin domain-containing protein [Phycisphaerales bacterium]